MPRNTNLDLTFLHKICFKTYQVILSAVDNTKPIRVKLTELCQDRFLEVSFKFILLLQGRLFSDLLTATQEVEQRIARHFESPD